MSVADEAVPAADDLIAALRARRGVKWSSCADGAIPAWIADMDLPVAAPITRFVEGAARAGDLGYPPRVDSDPLAAVFSERMARRHGWRPDPGRVELLADVVQGIYIALDVYAREGQGALIQTPIYPPFLDAARETGRGAVTCDLVGGSAGFEIDFDALDAAAARARVLMLCNPHNPTGRVFTRDELLRIAAIAEARDLVVLCDEIHSDLCHDGREHVPFASLAPEVEARTVTFNSATKAFNTAGIRCAVAAFGSDALLRRFRAVPRRVRGGLGIFATEVTRIAWTVCDDWQARTLSLLGANRDRVANFVATRMPGIGHVAPEATYLAWLDCRELERGGLSPGRFFEERAGVVLQDGSLFGEVGRGWARLNFATDPVVLEAILERMAGAVG